MMKKLACFCIMAGLLIPGLSMAATVWNLAGPGSGIWGAAGNWSAGLPGVTETKTVFNVPGAADCRVTASYSGMWLVQGDNNPGGIITVESGASLDVSSANAWSAIGYNNTAYMKVETGGTVTFNQAWIGFTVGGHGTLDISGTVNVNNMLGLGWSGGDGFINVLDGGLLALSNIHAAGDSIKQNSVLDLSGSGQLTLPGNFTSVLQSYVTNGKITGEGVVGNVQIDTTTNPGFTTAMAGEDEPPVETVPDIAIRHLGGNEIELSWPKGQGPYEPESTGDLMSTGVWSSVNGAIVIASNQYSKIVTTDDPSAFYRLYLAAADNSTLTGKSMMGYQGWFSAYGDGSTINDRWHHWGGGWPSITDWGIDFYPDMSEYSPDELYTPGWTLNNGETAYLYSAAHPKSVERHFRWMWEYGIDGVFLQRFLNEVTHDNRFINFRNTVTQNVRAGAEAHGRLYAIMYDVSGVADADMLNYLINDWNYLTGTLDITNSPSYARHNGKPVVSIWGLGFKDRGLTPATATAIINFFKAQGMTVKGGVPARWRTLSVDSETDPAWAAVYRSFDIISPWTVGRYSSIPGVDSWRVSQIEPDLAAATAAGADYMPVIFPGFSWYNIHDGPLNQIPRLGGNFYWRQAYNAVDAGCSMLYTAMFDEVDEGTAMYKMAETWNDLPAGASMVPLDVDGIALPSDWYLQVGGEAARMLRGEIPVQSTLPISP